MSLSVTPNVGQTNTTYEYFKAENIDKGRSALLSVGTEPGEAATTFELYEGIKKLESNIDKSRAAILATAASAAIVDAREAVSTYEDVRSADPDIEKFRSSILAQAAILSARSGAATVAVYQDVKDAVPDIDKDRAAILTSAAVYAHFTADDAGSVYEDVKESAPKIDKDRAAMLAAAVMISGDTVSDVTALYEDIKAADPNIDKHRAAILTGAAAIADVEPDDVVEVYEKFKELNIDKDRSAILTAAAFAPEHKTGLAAFTAGGPWLQLGYARVVEEGNTIVTDLRMARPLSSGDSDFAEALRDVLDVRVKIEALRERPLTEVGATGVNNAVVSVDKAIATLRGDDWGSASSVIQDLRAAEEDIKAVIADIDG